MIPYEDRFSIAPFGLRMPGFFFFPGCGCCEPCDPLHETATYTASDWSVRSGTWSAGPPWKVTTAGILISNFANPQADNTVKIEATLECDEIGAQVGIVFDYVDDDNYHICTMEGLSFLTIRIYKKTAGAVSQVGNGWGTQSASSVGDGKTLTVCVKSDTVSGYVGTELLFSHGTTLHGGKKAGIIGQGTGVGGSGAPTSSHPLIVSRFYYSRADACGDSSACPECAPCATTSGYYGKLPGGLKLVVSGFSDGSCTGGSCASKNATYVLPSFTFRRDHTGFANTMCRILSTGGTAPCSGTGSSTVQVTLLSDRLQILFAYTLGLAHDVVHGGTFDYVFSDDELCDMTTLVDAPAVKNGVTNGVCNASSVSILITAL